MMIPSCSPGTFKGASINEVQAMVENHLKSVILKTFDPKKADAIFNDEGDVSANVCAVMAKDLWLLTFFNNFSFCAVVNILDLECYQLTDEPQ